MSDPPAQAEVTSAETCPESPATPVLGTQYLCEGPDPITSNGRGDIVKMYVPAGAVSAEVVVIGGGGGGGANVGELVTDGGHGARVEATLNMQGIDSLLLTLAGGGQGYWIEASEGDVDGPQSGGMSGIANLNEVLGRDGNEFLPVGHYGRFGSGGHGHRFSTGIDERSWSDANATGGGMSAIVDATGMDPGAEMSVEDVLVVAGGGGGASKGGHGAVDGPDGGDGSGQDTSPAQGGAARNGGNGGNSETGLNGLDFGSGEWGAGGAHTQVGFYPYWGGTGGAGYGGGGAGQYGGGAAGGSFVVEGATGVKYMPAGNGGRPQSTGLLSGPGGAGSVTITFFGPVCSAEFSAGDGSEADPFQVATGQDLVDLRDNPACWDSYFLQTTDVNLGSTKWSEAIGSAATPFTGRYDGGGHSVSGLTIELSTNEAGLFGEVGSTGTILDLNFVGAVHAAASENVGGLVGTNDGVLSGLSADSQVVGCDYVGGLVGKNNGQITQSVASGQVATECSDGDGLGLGGLVGRNRGDIDASRATGDVLGSSTDRHVGGLVGWMSTSGASVSQSEASGSVSGDRNIGGLVGWISETASITQSWASGNVQGDDNAGGLVGKNGNLTDPASGTITDSFATGVVGASSDVGGLIGFNSGGQISRSYATSAVSGSISVGGLTGEDNAENPGTYVDSFWDSSATGQSSSAGGISKTTIEMKTLGTFDSWSIALGWSASETWGLCSTVNAGYPFLGTFYDTAPCSVSIPNAPQNLADAVSDGQVTFSWEAPANDGGGTIQRYGYQVDDGDWTDTGPTTSVTVAGDNGKPISFAVRAVNDAGVGDEATISATPATVPSAPQNVTATRRYESVDLNWDVPGDSGGSAIEDYKMRFRESGVSDWNYKYAPVQTTSLWATLLTAGVTYDFQVRARNGAGSGPWSPTVTAVAGSAPDPPANLSAAAGDGQVVFSWSPPAETGGTALKRYEYRVDGGSWVDNGLTLNATVSGVNGTAIDFEVRAQNKDARGSAASITGTPISGPGAPVDLSLSGGLDEVAASWSAPADDGGSAITGYEVQYSTSSSGPWTDWSSSGTSATITGLDAGVEYYVRVRAQNAAGDGAWVMGSATAGGAPSEPSGLSASAGDGQVEFSWSAPGQTGGSPVERYEYRVDGGSWVDNGLMLNVTISGANGTAIDFQVRAVNGLDTGSAASTTATPVESTDTPGVPSGVESMPGNGGLSLQWTEPVPGGAPISDFEYSVDGGAWASLNTTGSSASITSDGSGVSLANGQEYGVRIRARNANGAGDASSPVRQTPGVPLAPGNASGSWEESEFAMTWSAPNSNGSPITEYRISISTVSSRSGFLIARSGPGTYSTSSTTYSVTGLSPQSSYTVTITPRNGHGWGLSSTMSVGSSGSDAEDVVDQTPPAIIHQVPLPPTGTCEDIRDQAFGYQTDITGGWGRSWARWRNNGLGGPICTRMLVYDNSLPGWRLAS